MGTEIRDNTPGCPGCGHGWHLHREAGCSATECACERHPVVATVDDLGGRRVALDDLPGGDRVSTVRLLAGVDGDPDAYETLVTRGPHEGRCLRYATRAEAAAGHAEMVRALLAEVDRG